MMVSLGVIAGVGAGAIDAGLNTYVAAHFSEGLMQWLACQLGRWNYPGAYHHDIRFDILRYMVVRLSSSG